MRIPARSIAALLTIVCVATCSDAPTAARQNTTRESIAIDPAAIAASAHIADFGITYDHVRIVLVRPAADTVKDTTFVFFPATSGVALDIRAANDPSTGIILTVDALTTNEVFNVFIDFTNSSGIVFHGVGQVTGHGASDPTSLPQPIVVNYVGPGASVARVVVSPKTASLVAPGGQTFTVASFDANNAALIVPVEWSSSDPSVATISSDGKLASTGKRGSVTITATTPTGKLDSASVIVSLPAAAIHLVSGASQTGKAGAALASPAVVNVTATDGVGVAGVTVTFTAPVGGAVSTASAITDATGTASTSLTLGKAIGAQSFTAAAAGFQIAIAETATAADAAAITIVSGSGQSDIVGKTLANPLVVKVVDAFNNAAPGVTVNWSRGGFGTLSAATSLTGADGQASISYALGTFVESETITASVSGVAVTATFTVQVLAGAASGITVTGNNQTATVNTAVAIAPSVKIVDANNNPIQGLPVTFAPATGSGVVAPAGGGVRTDALGVASLTSWTLGPSAGAQSLVVSAAGLTSVTIHATANASVATSIIAMSGSGQTAQTGAGLTSPLVVKVMDASSNPVAGVLVTWIATNGVLGAPTTTSDASGLSSNTLTAGTTVGGATATASIAGGANAAFAEIVTAGPIAGLTLTTAPQTSDSNNVIFAIAPAVQLIDAANHAIALANVVVTMTAVPPSSGTPSTTPTLLAGTSTTITANTNASGVATFTGVRAVGLAQDYAIRFSVTPAATTFTRTSSDIHLLVGPATQLIAAAGDNQFALINTALAIPARVQLRDTLGQATAYPIATITYSVSGTGAGATPASASTNGSGFADATWTVGGVEGAAVLTAHATLGGAARTAIFNATAADIHAMALVATPTTATNGFALAPQPTIQLNDGTPSHNALPKAGVVITATVAAAPGSTGGIANNTATFTRSGTATATTDANGLATFTNLGVLSTQGGLTGRFTFTVTSGTTQTIAAITTDVIVNAGAAVIIQRNTNLVLTTTVGTAFSTFPSVMLRDVAGSPVPNSSGASITFSVPSGACTTSAVLTTTATDGTATLSSGNLTVPNVAGSCVVRATSPTLAGSPIDFDIVVGPATGFAWIGAIDNDYTRNFNWLAHVAPGSGAVDIFVPTSVPNAPSVIAATTVRNVTLEGGASLNVGANTYTITGTTSAGTASTFTILSGATALFQGATTTLGNLTVNSGTARFSHNASVSGALSALNSAVVNHTAGGLTLTIAGSLTSSSGTTLSGLSTVSFTGSTFPVYGNATTAGTPVVTTIAHNMSVPSGVASFVNNLTVSDAALSINGNATVLTVGASLDVKSSTGASGEVLMNSGDPTLIVTGTAIFEGKAQNGQGLTTGTLDLRGDFMQRDRTTGSHGEFEPGPAPFVVKFTGGGSGQNVRFDHPGTSPTTESYFTNVLVVNQGGVTQSTHAYINGGTMTVGGPPADAGSPAFWSTGVGSSSLFVTGGGALAVRQSGSFTVVAGGALDLTGGSCTQYQAGLVTGTVNGGTCTIDSGLIGSTGNLFRLGVVGFR